MSPPSEHWLQRVRYTAAEPKSWLSHARTLRQAAEDLWIAGNRHVQTPGSELGSEVLGAWSAPGYTPPETGGSTRDVCFMLFGFALENLAKGIIVCRNPKLVDRERLHRWHRKGHKIAELFDWAEISLTDTERQLLVRMTRMTEWKGRYPVPMDFYEVGLQDPLIGYIAVSNSWPSDDYEVLSAVYDKAKATLIQTMNDVPALPADYEFGSG
jgi:hypothetical protein